MAAPQLTAEQIALIALQDELVQTRIQNMAMRQRLDTLIDAHEALKSAHELLQNETERVLSERKAEIEDIGTRIRQLLAKQRCDLLDLKVMKPTIFKGLSMHNRLAPQPCKMHDKLPHQAGKYITSCLPNTGRCITSWLPNL